MSEKIDGNRDKRFCTSCQTMRPAGYGKMLEGKINRWQCTACAEKRSKPLYAKKRGEGDA